MKRPYADPVEAMVNLDEVGMYAPTSRLDKTQIVLKSGGSMVCAMPYEQVKEALRYAWFGPGHSYNNVQ